MFFKKIPYFILCVLCLSACADTMPATQDNSMSFDNSLTTEAAESVTPTISPAMTSVPTKTVTPTPEQTLYDVLNSVHGLKSMTVYEGMHPNVTAGITWDESVIQDVEADESAVLWDKEGEYELTYHLYSKEKIFDTQVAVHVRKNLEDYLYGMEGRAKIPIEEAENYDWTSDILYEENEVTIEADASSVRPEPGEYIILYTLKGKDGHTQTLNRVISVVDQDEMPTTLYVEDGTYSEMTDLGIWRLTAYMDTPEDQGPYVGQTASGAPLVAGRTVAVSSATCARLGLSFGDRLMINGHVYVLEDHGGSAMYDQDWVDIYVDNPQDEYSEAFNQYSHVYLLR